MKKTTLTTALVAAVLAPSVAMAQTPDGGALFKQRCTMCHTITPGAKGTLAPNLAGLSKRKAGSDAFTYSPALKASGIVWDGATLDNFLRAPSKMVPGTRMIVNVPNDAQRAAIVAYILSLKGK